MKNNIQILAPQEAKRIAAGEVIDRPAALVRELLDNAIDSGALNIEVSIEEGGCKKTEVTDDGTGMTKEDLQLCHLTHATSKIRCLDDLEKTKTLGFRGEALAAISAVARLEIITSRDGREAWRLETGPGEKNPVNIEQTRRVKGTTVRALNLFESIPARKKFLKREGSEGALARQIFIDKALPFNNINFKFIQDGKLKDFLPCVETKKERFASAVLKHGEGDYLHEINTQGDGFTATIVIAGPELYRNDRRQIFIFANGRRVQDYSLIQAIEYGTQGWFPNGTHPIGAVFIEIDPSLADFNIHPAKKEVRFRDPGAIHQAVTGSLKTFFHKKLLREISHGEHGETEHTEKEEEKEKELFTQINIKTTEKMEEKGKLTNSNFVPSVPPCPNRWFECEKSSLNEFKYAGRVFGLFILIEHEDRLFIIDQHAAHERILYDKFLSRPIPKQELLSPIPFTTESEDEDNFLDSKCDELSRLGIDIQKDESGRGNWRIEALPSDWRVGDAATVKEILELRNAGENIAERWAASLCCKAAIKDGDYPDDETAFALGKEALALSHPVCPHGRPVWTEISREALFKAVRRL